LVSRAESSVSDQLDPSSAEAERNRFDALSD
jgi:hypothetical protein